MARVAFGSCWLAGIFAGMVLSVAAAQVDDALRRPFLEVTEQATRAVLDLNLVGVLALWQSAARHMAAAGHGVLLATASTNASAGYPYYADYNASKAAVRAKARTAAFEFAPIRTARVSPGHVMTPMQRAEYSYEMFEKVNRRIPVGRHAEPAEIASAFHYLASHEARYITGQQLVVDGGELAGGTASTHGTFVAERSRRIR